MSARGDISLRSLSRAKPLSRSNLRLTGRRPATVIRVRDCMSEFTKPTHSNGGGRADPCRIGRVDLAHIKLAKLPKTVRHCPTPIGEIDAAQHTVKPARQRRKVGCAGTKPRRRSAARCLHGVKAAPNCRPTDETTTLPLRIPWPRWACARRPCGRSRGGSDSRSGRNCKFGCREACIAPLACPGTGEVVRPRDEAGQASSGVGRAVG